MKIAKRFFCSILVFVIVFAALSLTIDIYYQHRNTCNLPGEDGWTGLSDFKVYWIAAGNLSRHIAGTAEPGQYPVYDEREGFFHFRYSPFAAFIMIPFSRFLYPATALFWWSILLNVTLLAALLLLANRIRHDFNAERQYGFAILWGVSIGTLKYYFMNVAQGQTDIIVAFLFVLFLISYIRNRETACGIIFALILQMKLLFVPMLVYFLFRRKIKLLVSTALAFAAFLFVPACALGLSGAFEMIKSWVNILTLSVPSQLLDYKNQSFVYAIVIQLMKNSTVKEMFSPAQLAYPLSAFFTLLAYVVTLWYGKFLRSQDETRFRYLEISILILVTLFFSPISWGAYYINLIIPLGITIYFTLKSAKRRLLYTALGAYMLLTSVYGTDLTDFMPVVNTWHFIHISIGTLFLAFAMLYSYRTYSQTCTPFYRGQVQD